MPSTHRVLSSLALAAVFGISAAFAQESVQVGIPNWPAPPLWAAQAVQIPAGLVEPREVRATRTAAHPESLAAVPTTSLTLIGINPCRIADTRDGTKPAGYGPPALSQGVARNFTLTGQCGIAGTAQAVSLNITVANTLGPGFISIYPQGGVAPLVSTLNYVAGQTVANAAVVPLGTGGGITVIAGVSGTDLILDTNGYYDTPGVDSEGVSSNPFQVALLKWYPGNQSATFAAGTHPYGVAFDGASMWVANNGTNNVMKLRASDGELVGTFPVGLNPEGVAFDGANIWVGNQGANTLTKLRASDGMSSGPFGVGSLPAALVFDGANIWTANFGSANVTKLRASDGACVGTCNFSVGSGPAAIAFDGANIWVANSGNGAGNTVTKLRASDGSTLGTFSVGTFPRGLAFDGSNIWVANFNSNTITKLRASDGANLGTFNTGSGPWAVAFDGANIWVTNDISNTITKLRATDGGFLGTFNVGMGPAAIGFDGAYIWVANYNSNSLTKL
jgi:hypothetical protein